MRWRVAIAPLIAAALLAALAGVAAAQGVSPGPLSRDHDQLDGVDHCRDCHSSGEAIATDKCLGCHKALGQRIAAGAGFHAVVKRDCATCHIDHRGRDAALVHWPGGSPTLFDHTGLAGYRLDGKHAGLDCKKCHTPALLTGKVAAALTAAERPRTYLGLSTRCAACHRDPHQPTLGNDCQRCHGAASWQVTRSSPQGFDHGRTRFPLRGGHATVGCAKCHGGTDQKLARLKIPFDTCATCHEDPHAGALGDAAACARCHGEDDWKKSRYQPRAHAPRTFPLRGGHASPPCAKCHGDKLDQKVSTACASCHPDPHRPSLGAACQSCHQVTAWTGKATPAKPTFHDRTAYPLLGRHRQVACARCHDPRKPARSRYRPLPHARCTDCHADAHQGEASGDCDRCHDLDGFTPARFELADHARTRFPLEGAHRAQPCITCHPASPAPPGFRRGAPACEACHQDPHGGQFAATTGGCATCHRVAAWAPSRFGKREHAASGFALAGKHAVACGRCHGGVAGAVVRFVDLASDCGACHDDRHFGQFGGRLCGSCHAGDRFRPAAGFDHAASFALRGRHATARCGRCHPQVAAAGGHTALYRLAPVARTCAGCHRDQHGDAGSPRAQQRQLATRTRACADCHGEDDWQGVARAPGFDHAVTGAPLVDGHARVRCGACHQTGRKTAALTDCAGCHPDRHAGRMGDRCERCHSARSWKQDALLVDHQRTRLPLVGAHAVQGCPTCHRNAMDGDYRGLDPACAGCHQHTVDERRPHPDHHDPAFAPCQDCHSALGWRPARIDHDRYWRLTGAHTTTPCGSCHQNGYAGTPTTCISCHQQDRDDGPFDHSGFDSTRCERCHTTTAWVPAGFPDHDPFFPLRGKHALPCASCHTTQGMWQLFECTTCHAHSRSEMDDKHHEVGGYSYDSAECYRCHPNGKGGG